MAIADVGKIMGLKLTANTIATVVIGSHTQTPNMEHSQCSKENLTARMQTHLQKALEKIL